MTKNPSPLSSRPPTADGRPSDSDRARSSDLTGEEQGREPSSAAAAASAAAEASTGSSSGSAASSGQGDASAAETVQEDVGAVPVDAALEVEELDTDLYQSKRLWQPARARGVFGGQVIGMALASSSKTVRPEMTLHSLHCYFLLAGDRTRPILYQVQRIRDGGSYATRQVNAQQRGRCIFTVMLSYQVPEPKQRTFAIPLPPPLGADGTESDASVQSSAPASPPATARADTSSSSSSSTYTPSPSSSARLFQPTTSFSRSLTPNEIVASLPSPEDCPLNEQRYVDVLERYGSNVPPKLSKLLTAWIRDRRKSPVEIRNALPGMYDENGLPTAGHEQAFWLRCKQPVTGGLEAQKAALAYSSDFQFLSSIPKALGNSPNIKMMASLDHSMWFYDDNFDVSEYMLFLMQAQAASNGRGVALGRIYRRDGTLVAVLAQEGMVRENLEHPRVKL